jgi:hypothetical protein
MHRTHTLSLNGPSPVSPSPLCVPPIVFKNHNTSLLKGCAASGNGRTVALCGLASEVTVVHRGGQDQTRADGEDMAVDLLGHEVRRVEAGRGG